MPDVLEKLRRLRQDAGVAAPARATARAPAVDEPARDAFAPPKTRPEVPEHIRRLLGIRAKATAPRPAAAPRVQATDRHVPGEEIAPGLHYTEEHVPWHDTPPVLDAAFAKLGPIQRERLLHFDTETTGLAGGTGTRAFMIGAADWRDGGLRLRQLTITTMAAEAGMLRTFAGWLPPGTALVSYNGKCYDAPLLNTRYRLARQPSPLTGLLHLDLLHPARLAGLPARRLRPRPAPRGRTQRPGPAQPGRPVPAPGQPRTLARTRSRTCGPGNRPRHPGRRIATSSPAAQARS